MPNDERPQPNFLKEARDRLRDLATRYSYGVRGAESASEPEMDASASEVPSWQDLLEASVDSLEQVAASVLGANPFTFKQKDPEGKVIRVSVSGAYLVEQYAAGLQKWEGRDASRLSKILERFEQTLAETHRAVIRNLKRRIDSRYPNRGVNTSPERYRLLNLLEEGSLDNIKIVESALKSSASVSRSTREFSHHTDRPRVSKPRVSNPRKKRRKPPQEVRQSALVERAPMHNLRTLLLAVEFNVTKLQQLGITSLEGKGQPSLSRYLSNLRRRVKSARSLKARERLYEDLENFKVRTEKALAKATQVEDNNHLPIPNERTDGAVPVGVIDRPDVPEDTRHRAQREQERDREPEISVSEPVLSLLGKAQVIYPADFRDFRILVLDPEEERSKFSRLEASLAPFGDHNPDVRLNSWEAFLSGSKHLGLYPTLVLAIKALKLASSEAFSKGTLVKIDDASMPVPDFVRTQITSVFQNPKQIVPNLNKALQTLLSAEYIGDASTPDVLSTSDESTIPYDGEWELSENTRHAQKLARVKAGMSSIVPVLNTALESTIEAIRTRKTRKSTRKPARRAPIKPREQATAEMSLQDISSKVKELAMTYETLPVRLASKVKMAIRAGNEREAQAALQALLSSIKKHPPKRRPRQRGQRGRRSSHR